MKTWVKTIKEFQYYNTPIAAGVTLGCDSEEQEVIDGLKDGTLVTAEAPKEARGKGKSVQGAQ